jgi:hypothetical protein
MLSRALLLILLAGPVAGPLAAEPADCRSLSLALRVLTGFAVTAPPAGAKDGWCVLDRGVLKTQGAPDLAVDRLRLKGETAEGALVSLSLEAGGLRVAPGLPQSYLDPVLRETLRLQSAEVTATLRVGPEGLVLRYARLRLTGGTEIMVEADIAGAGLSAGSLLASRVTFARIDWRNDGKLLRPAMQAWGERLVDSATGEAGIGAARVALRQLAGNLPGSLFVGDGLDRLEAVLDALPQGRGRLRLEFRSPEGIGMAGVGIAALSDDPLGPEALARLFGGARVTVDWQPGIAP